MFLKAKSRLLALEVLLSLVLVAVMEVEVATTGLTFLKAQ
jgi:hypothetical protein